MHFIISCAAGLESVLRKEVELAGYHVTNNQPALIRFVGDQTAIARINLRSRVWNKLFLELGKKHISDFDGLFDLVSQIDWSLYVQGNPIVVTAMSKKSKLTSTPAIQSICKKAIVKKLLKNPTPQDPCRDAGNASPKLTPWCGVLFEDSALEPVEILVHIENDQCSILLNTTGESLHKRWYRKETGEAPINESLAAWLVLLSWWKFSEPLYDFFCGSGTIAIEAAMIAKNIAPWLLRKFAFQHFARYDKKYYEQEFTAAKQKIMTNKEHTLLASDIDPQMIELAKINAKHAGVENYIQFSVHDVKDYLVTCDCLLGAVVSNPPYGLRLHNIVHLAELYKNIVELFAIHPRLHGGIITSYEQFESTKLSGNRKKSPLYNGGEQCRFWKKSLL